MVSSERTEQMLAPAPRSYEVGVGWVLAGFALLILLLPVAVYQRFLSQRGWPHLPRSQRIDDLTWAGGGLVLGLLLMTLAIQLILGWTPRRDGGLFSPGVLRLCGLALAVMPFALLFFSPWMALKAALFW